MRESMSDEQVPETPAEMTSNIELDLCPSCGQPVSPDSRFCSSCGTSLTPTDTGVLPPVHDTGPLPVMDPDLLGGMAPGEAVLVIQRGAAPGTTVELRGDLVTLGRGDDSTVFLDDVTVSRRHAELKRGDDGWSLTDAGSLNGSYVNKKNVENQVLQSGDEVQIGKYRFLFLEVPPV